MAEIMSLGVAEVDAGEDDGGGKMDAGTNLLSTPTVLRLRLPNYGDISRRSRFYGVQVAKP